VLIDEQESLNTAESLALATRSEADNSKVNEAMPGLAPALATINELSLALREFFPDLSLSLEAREGATSWTLSGRTTASSHGDAPGERAMKCLQEDVSDDS
jgi:hypothetical protein